MTLRKDVVKAEPQRTGGGSRAINLVFVKLDENVRHRLVGVLSQPDRQHRRFTHGLNVSFSGYPKTAWGLFR